MRLVDSVQHCFCCDTQMTMMINKTIIVIQNKRLVRTWGSLWVKRNSHVHQEIRDMGSSCVSNSCNGVNRRPLYSTMRTV